MMDARVAYCDALRLCDEVYKQTANIDAAVEPLATMIGRMLIEQLK